MKEEEGGCKGGGRGVGGPWIGDIASACADPFKGRCGGIRAREKLIDQRHRWMKGREGGCKRAGTQNVHPSE